MPSAFDLPEDHPLHFAHKKSANHRADVERSRLSGCFYCKSMFSPDQIVEWIEEDGTALCPVCGIGSVVADGSNLLMAKDFLEAMQAAWFAGIARVLPFPRGSLR
jgi:hypothetical protein